MLAKYLGLILNSSRELSLTFSHQDQSVIFCHFHIIPSPVWAHFLPERQLPYDNCWLQQIQFCLSNGLKDCKFLLISLLFFLANNAVFRDKTIHEYTQENHAIIHFLYYRQLDKERGNLVEVEVILGTHLRSVKAKGLKVPHLQHIYSLCSAIKVFLMNQKK